MGIVISHQPVGAPIIAGYATGVGRAAERRTERQTKMMMQQQEIKQRNMLQQNQQNFTAEQNRLNRTAAAEADAARVKQQNERDERRNQQFRDRDETNRLWDDINTREKWMMGADLSDEGRKQAQEAAASLDWIRRNQGEYRPEEHRQFLSQWLKEFDTRRSPTWENQPRTPMDDINERGVYHMPDGRFVPIQEYDGSGEGVFLMPDANGKLYEPYKRDKEKKAGFPATPDEFYSDERNLAWGMKEAKEQIKAEAMAQSTEDNVVEPDMSDDNVLDKMDKLYEMRRKAASPRQAKPDPNAPPPPPSPGTLAELEARARGEIPAQQSDVPLIYQDSPEEARQRANQQIEADRLAMTGAPGTPGGRPFGDPRDLQRSQVAAQQEGSPQPTAAPDPSQQGGEAHGSQQVEWATGVVNSMRQRYGSINGLDDISNPPDRLLLEKAFAVLDNMQ
jgi:hypothetical protein